MKRKKELILLSCIILIVGITLFINDKSMIVNIRTDSGFDSSYDSGSWDSGSSWGGSSSWDNSSSWDSSFDWDNSSSSHSYSSRGGGKNGWMFIVTIIITVIIILVIDMKAKKKTNNIGQQELHKKENLETLKKVIPNFDEEKFLNERYLDYVTIQEAWMNFDYETLRQKLTDELYNQYIMQLDTLKLKKQQNIMSDFIYKDANIITVTMAQDKLSVEIELTVEFFDYIEKENKVVRGSDSRKIIMNYLITFVCSQNNQADTCPNCGAKVEDSASKKCPYCNSVITGLSKEWVMSKKEAKGQQWK